MLVDHYGLFLDPEQTWWRVPGRLAAPIFFFLIGFGRTRGIPLSWLWLGVALTLIEVWTSGNGLAGLEFNILLSFALLRLVLPLLERAVLPSPLRVVALLGATLLLIWPGRILEYGAEGWLWAYFGLAQRLAAERPDAVSRRRALALGLVATAVYVGIESFELEPTLAQAVVLSLLFAGLLATLLVFRRGPAAVQPPRPIATPLRLCGRHSLEIYAVTLAAMQLGAFWWARTA